MRKITRSLALLMALFVFTGCQPGQGGRPDLVPKEESEKVLYTVGSMFGSRLKELELSENEIDLVLAGVRDSANKNRKVHVDIDEFGPKVRDFFRQRANAKSEQTKKQGAAYMEATIAKEGMQKTPSGLAYKILAPGTGKAPTATDVVKVHYEGKLTDGTVFDSSRERDKPVTFPLNRVIKGWTEGLQLIKTGGKIKLLIPSELGYGDHGAPPKIPGGATLAFEVELLGIEPPAEEEKKGAAKKK